MAKYRALLYREWRLSRKHHITNLIVLILLAVLLDLILLSAKIGNLAPAVQQDADTAELFDILGIYAFPMFIAMGAGIVAFTDAGIIRTDIQSNWLRYSFGLPITPVMRTAVQYTITVIAMVIAYIISVINLLISNAIFDKAVNPQMYTNILLFFAVGAFIHMLQQFFFTKARSEIALKKQTAKHTFATMGVYLVIGFAGMRYLTKMILDIQDKAIQYADETEAAGNMVDSSVSEAILFDGIKEHLLSLRDALAPWAIPAIIVFLALGFFFTMQNYKRREQ